MSYTSLVSVYPNEGYEDVQEFRNSWLSAPLVWDALAKKYLGRDTAMFGGEMDKLWALFSDPRLSEAERAIFGMTFDYSIIYAANFDRASTDIAKAITVLNIDGHWPAISAAFASKPKCPALHIWCTSVSECSFPPRHVEDEDEDQRRFDWHNIWDLYARLDAQATA